jgi:hypothetical protein
MDLSIRLSVAHKFRKNVVVIIDLARYPLGLFPVSIPVLGIPHHPGLSRSLNRENVHRLMLVRLRHWNPDAYSLRARRHILYGEVVGEAKSARWRTELCGIRRNLRGQVGRLD